MKKASTTFTQHFQFKTTKQDILEDMRLIVHKAIDLPWWAFIRRKKLQDAMNKDIEMLFDLLIEPNPTPHE